MAQKTKRAPALGLAFGRLLDVEGTASVLLTSPKTVRRLIASGELPAFKVGNLLRVAEPDLMAFLSRHRIGKP